MKRTEWLVFGFMVLVGLTGCAHIQEQKRREDIFFDPAATQSDPATSDYETFKTNAQNDTDNDSRYLLTTEEIPEAKPR